MFVDPRYRDWMIEVGRAIAAKMASGEFDSVVSVMQRVGRVDEQEARAIYIRDCIAAADSEWIDHARCDLSVCRHGVF